MTKRIRVRKFTKQDENAQARLRAIWERKKKPLDLTQQKVADDWGRTQGLVTQYLNGIIPLGPVAILRFARILRVQPTEIRPDFEFGNFTTDDLDQDAIDVAVKWAALPPDIRADVRRWIETVHETGYAEFLDKATKPRKRAKIPAHSTK